jgi:hypothetical protein
MNARMTNRMHRTEWYNCQRCGEQFPRKDVIVHNGLVICVVRCKDEPGRDAFVKQTEIRREAPPDPLPQVSEDL